MAGRTAEEKGVSPAKFIISIVAMFGFGLVVSVLLFLGLGLVAKAFGAEATPTYEATIGQQNRSLNYKTAADNTVQAAREYYIPGRARLDTLQKSRCQERNRHLILLVSQIASYIAADPEHGYIFVGALQTIHDNWCIAP